MGALLSILMGCIARWSVEEEKTWDGLLCFEGHVKYGFCFVEPT